MTSLLLGAILSGAAYKFEPATRVNLDLTVTMDGFLPVLGGNEGKVEVKMGVLVEGQQPSGTDLRAASEIKEFGLRFNGERIPLSVDNVREFFPRSTVTFSPIGRIIKNDAPDRQLPVKLPGLDAKRFPDITFLPIELPAEGLKQGGTWTFSKKFGESDLNYTCVAQEVTDVGARIAVAVLQSYEVFENDYLEIVTDQAKAVNKVATTMTGEGIVVFDLARGLATAVDMTNTAVSRVSDAATGAAKGERKLQTVLNVRVRQPAMADKPAPAPQPRTLAEHAMSLWNRARTSTSSLWDQARGYYVVLRLAVANGGAGMPAPADLWQLVARQFASKVLGQSN